MRILIFLILIYDKVDGYKKNDEIEIEILNKGQIAYELIMQRSKIGINGNCWFDAVKDFEAGCNHLTEQVHVELSIRFANCFLEMTDQPQIPCNAETKENIRRICFQEMNDRAFATFTEFYTHAQNMCFFLHNKMWHKETEHTIEMLGMISKHVAVKLVLAEQQQEELLIQQKVGLELQKQIYEHGTHLSDTLFQSRKNLEKLTEEFRTSTFDNNQIILEIFSRIHSIQTWLLGDYSLFNSLIYFVCSLVLIIILTSSRRTSSSRLVLLSILIINILSEYLVRSYFLTENFTEGDILEVKYILDKTIWIFRRCFMIISVILWLVKGFKYCDINEANNIMLNDLLKENNTIKTELAHVKDMLTKAILIRENKSLQNPIVLGAIEESALNISFSIENGNNSHHSELLENSLEENLSINTSKHRNRISSTSTPIDFKLEPYKYNLRSRPSSRIALKNL